MCPSTLLALSYSEQSPQSLPPYLKNKPGFISYGINICREMIRVMNKYQIENNYLLPRTSYLAYLLAIFNMFGIFKLLASMSFFGKTHKSEFQLHIVLKYNEIFWKIVGGSSLISGNMKKYVPQVKKYFKEMFNIKLFMTLTSKYFPEDLYIYIFFYLKLQRLNSCKKFETKGPER